MSYSHNDVVGYVDNLVDGRKDINQGDQDSFRLSGYWKGETVSVQASIMTFGLDPQGKIDQVTMQAISPIADFSWDFQDLLFKPVQSK